MLHAAESRGVGDQGNTANGNSQDTFLNLSADERSRRDALVAEFSNQIMYSKRYNDDQYEYR